MVTQIKHQIDNIKILRGKKTFPVEFVCSNIMITLWIECKICHLTLHHYIEKTITFYLRALHTRINARLTNVRPRHSEFAETTLSFDITVNNLSIVKLQDKNYFKMFISHLKISRYIKKKTDAVAPTTYVFTFKFDDTTTANSLSKFTIYY